MNLQQARLRTRIVASFVLAGALVGFLVFTSWLAIRALSGEFERYGKMSQRSQLALRITEAVSDLQRHALTYTFEGHRSSAEEVDRVRGALVEDIARAQDIADEDTGALLERMSAHLAVYEEAFAQVVTQRRLRKALISEGLVQTSSAAEAALERAERTLPAAHRPNAQRAKQAFLRAQLASARYFESLDAANVREAKVALSSARAGLEVAAKRTDEAKEGPCRVASAAVVAYEHRFLEAVQRTRGYLVLVNVVMAAEAYEVMYAARRLEDLDAQRMGAAEAEIHAFVARTSKWSTALGGSALLVLLAFSVMLFRSIRDPIVRLSETFRDLAHGGRETVIPAYPIDDELGELTAAASVFRDKNVETKALLAQSRALTEDLEEKQRALTRSNEELEQFVYTVSHDLKSPLVTSQGFITIARRLADRGDVEGALSKLGKVVQANERMGELINDLLELSRVGRVDQERADVDLARVALEVKRSFEPALQQAGLQLGIDGSMPVVRANESRIRQVFENLVGNAIKYAAPPQGSRIQIGTRPDADASLIYVRDDGPGIDSRYHDRIFGLFYRLDSKREGTGIGLAVVKKIMRAHDGEVWVDSKPEEGATFWLRFPLRGQEERGDGGT